MAFNVPINLAAKNEMLEQAMQQTNGVMNLISTNPKLDSNLKKHLTRQSIDVRNMVGSIALKQQEVLTRKRKNSLLSVNQDPRLLVEILRHKNNRVKAHFTCFQSKALLFFHIMADLNAKVDKRMQKLLKEFILLKLEIMNLEQNLKKDSMPRTRERSELMIGVDFSEFKDLGENDLKEKLEEEHLRNKSAVDLDIVKEMSKEIVAGIDKYIKEIEECYFGFQKEILKEFKTRKHVNVMVQIDKNFRQFTTMYSKIVRKIMKGEDIEGNIDPDANLAVLEFKFCWLGNYFRQNLSKGLTDKYHQIGGRLEEIFLKFEELQDKIKFFEGYLVESGSKRRIKHDFKDIENCWKMVSFFYLLDPPHQRFIKNKLNLPSDVKVFNEELFDFMDMYSMTYDSTTPLILEYLEGKMSTKKDSPKECILCLDVKSPYKIFLRFLAL
jgi:FtsZ-binding cell division protein ZapB